MAKIGTLVETFTTAWGADWTNTADTNVAVVSNGLRIDHDATTTHHFLASVTTWDLTASSAYVQVVDFGDQTIAHHELLFVLQIDPSNRLEFVVYGGTIYCRYAVANVNTVLGSGTPIGTWDWLRIREGAGTTFWEASTDGLNWIVLQSVANPITETAVGVRLSTGNWATDTASFVIFDNFNNNASGSPPHEGGGGDGMQIWDGGAWAWTAPRKYWNGTTWVLVAEPAFP